MEKEEIKKKLARGRWLYTHSSRKRHYFVGDTCVCGSYRFSTTSPGFTDREMHHLDEDTLCRGCLKIVKEWREAMKA